MRSYSGFLNVAARDRQQPRAVELIRAVRRFCGTGQIIPSFFVQQRRAVRGRVLPPYRFRASFHHQQAGLFIARDGRHAIHGRAGPRAGLKPVHVLSPTDRLQNRPSAHSPRHDEIDAPMRAPPLAVTATPLHCRQQKPLQHETVDNEEKMMITFIDAEARCLVFSNPQTMTTRSRTPRKFPENSNADAFEQSPPNIRWRAEIDAARWKNRKINETI